MIGGHRIPRQVYTRNLKHYKTGDLKKKPDNQELLDKVVELLQEKDMPTVHLMKLLGLTGNTEEQINLEYDIVRFCPNVWQDNGFWGLAERDENKTLQDDLKGI